MATEIITKEDLERFRSQFVRFYQSIESDSRISATHISLYMALFQYWNLSNCKEPISISRQEIMVLAKISSSATYHKYLKDLVEYRFINYIPSCNPFLKSLVYLEALR